jgi:hypothetical protein
MTGHVRLPASVLLVEPDMLSQAAVLDAVRATRAEVEVSCVSTCGGGCSALGLGGIDAVLISTNLCLAPDERRQLAELMRRASTLGLPMLTLSPPGPALHSGALGVVVHESLGHAELLRGELNAALERARACARFDQTLQRLSHYDRMALLGRALVGATRAGTDARRLNEWASALGGQRSPSALAVAQVEQVLESSLALTRAIAASSNAVVRSYTATAAVALDEVLLGQVFTNLLLMLVASGGPAGLLTLAISATPSHVVVQLSAASTAQGDAPLADPLPRNDGPSDGLGLWVSRHLLRRWGADLKVREADGASMTVRVDLPIPLCFAFD